MYDQIAVALHRDPTGWYWLNYSADGIEWHRFTTRHTNAIDAYDAGIEEATRIADRHPGYDIEDVIELIEWQRDMVVMLYETAQEIPHSC